MSAVQSVCFCCLSLKSYTKFAPSNAGHHQLCHQSDCALVGLHASLEGCLGWHFQADFAADCHSCIHRGRRILYRAGHESCHCKSLPLVPCCRASYVPFMTVAHLNPVAAAINSRTKNMSWSENHSLRMVQKKGGNLCANVGQSFVFLVTRKHST
jgi:hypothetical protein